MVPLCDLLLSAHKQKPAGYFSLGKELVACGRVGRLAEVLLLRSCPAAGGDKYEEQFLTCGYFWF